MPDHQVSGQYPNPGSGTAVPARSASGIATGRGCIVGLAQALASSGTAGGNTAAVFGGQQATQLLGYRRR